MNAVETFTFAHLSDPHLSSLDGVRIQDLLNKRVLGYLSWRSRRRAEHCSEVLTALRRDLEHTQPDHIIVTGDLTHLGLPSEFQEARQWLQELGDPAYVTVIPGNHDAYISTRWEDTFALWASFMASDDADAQVGEGSDNRAAFPSLRIRGSVAFIGLSTARPSAPFFATGSLGQAQLRKLEKMLADTGQQELLRVVLIHHPPMADTVSWRRCLTDSEALRAVLVKQGVDLVLHGHAHRVVQTRLETPAGNVPVIGVPSASAIGHKPGRRAQYNLYRLIRHQQGWELEIAVRGYSLTEDRFVAEGESQLTLPRLMV